MKLRYGNENRKKKHDMFVHFEMNIFQLQNIKFLFGILQKVTPRPLAFNLNKVMPICHLIKTI